MSELDRSVEEILGDEELERQQGEPLPNREVMSLISPQGPLGGPLPPVELTDPALPPE